MEKKVIEQNNIYYTKSDTPEMIATFKMAQNTFKYFWRELSWEQRRIVPALDMSGVKAIFNQESSTDTPLGEYMWIGGNIFFDGIFVSGTLLNKPDILTNVKQGELVGFPLERVADWMFYSGKKVYGGFTVQLMRSQMDKKEREKHDKAWGMDFGDPDKILLVFDQEKCPGNLIEHPMCINMKQKFEEYLKQNPNGISEKDELGYTWLHKETIAGNKTNVEMLLEMGSDINAKIDAGYTALDFAQKLEWEHIIPIFKNKL